MKKVTNLTPFVKFTQGNDLTMTVTFIRKHVNYWRNCVDVKSWTKFIISSSRLSTMLDTFIILWICIQKYYFRHKPCKLDSWFMRWQRIRRSEIHYINEFCQTIGVYYIKLIKHKTFWGKYRWQKSYISKKYLYTELLWVSFELKSLVCVRASCFSVWL